MLMKSTVVILFLTSQRGVVHDRNKLQFCHFPKITSKHAPITTNSSHYVFLFLTWLIIHIVLDFKCLRTHTKGDFFLIIWKIIHSIIKNPVEKKKDVRIVNNTINIILLLLKVKGHAALGDSCLVVYFFQIVPKVGHLYLQSNVYCHLIIISISTQATFQTTLKQHLNQYLVETWSTSQSTASQESTNFRRHAIECWSIHMGRSSLGQLSTDCRSGVNQVLIECWARDVFCTHDLLKLHFLLCLCSHKVWTQVFWEHSL